MIYGKFIYSTIAINFISSKDAGEECLMHLKNNKIKFKSFNDANEGADELFKALPSRYQENLETSIKRE